MTNYLLMVLFFLILSLVVLMFMFSKMSFSTSFLNKFLNLGMLIFFMVVVNIYMVTVQDMSKFMGGLMFLSFYSLLLMGFGYGVGKKLNFMILFKVLADILLYILMGYFYFFGMDKDILTTVWLGGLKMNLEILLISMFSMYSLLGLFGFWVYWAMEASYFISVYMHSCGFVALGLVMFLKMVVLELSNLEDVKNFIFGMSAMSYLFFVNLFLTIKDLKKSFGYFSASSMCFLFTISMVSPAIASMYFFMSSAIKMVIFELMSFVNKSKPVSWWIFFWLCVLYVTNYSVFIMTPILSSSSVYGDFLSVFVFVMFFFKIYYLFMFLVKVLIIFGDCEISYITTSMEGDSLLDFTMLFLLLLFLVYFLSLNNTTVLVGSVFVKHMFFTSMYLFFLQIMFLNWFLFLLGEKFKSFISMGFSVIVGLENNLSNFMAPLNLKVLIFHKKVSKVSMESGVFSQLALLWVFIFLTILFFS